jgi:hypothetical protein
MQGTINCRGGNGNAAGDMLCLGRSFEVISCLHWCGDVTVLLPGLGYLEVDRIVLEKSPSCAAVSAPS